MRAYYHLCRLERGRTMTHRDGQILVDLDGAASVAPITNDEELAANVGSNTFFWVSGGGSLLIDGRQLVVVERSLGSRVNPGKLSLFTGRADNPTEWREPSLLVRELFEELIVVDGSGAVRAPSMADIDVDAGAICRDYVERSGRSLSTEVVPLTEVGLDGSKVAITWRGTTRVHDIFLHVNAAQDVNALRLFTAQIPFDTFWAVDGEADGEADHAEPRRIFAIDVVTLAATNVTFGSNRDQVQLSAEQLTPHCQFLIDDVRRTISRGERP